MRIKRIVMWTYVALSTIILCYLICCLILKSKYDNWNWTKYDKYLAREMYMTFLGILVSIVLSTVCQLAVIDFVVCYEGKKYSKSMFGIAITLLMLFAVFIFTSVIFAVEIIPKAKDYYSWDYFGYFIWLVLCTTPIVGLAIAYGAVKWKFVRETSSKKIAKES